ncbi:MAG: cytidylate kinase-like family protein [Lentimicrobiaceae bacterium]|nr:cytidylate kinase-like family protein [Lentimicrobiaceae bacterium]
MKNLLTKYMEERFKGEVLPPVPQRPGSLPVVTISREAGCSGTAVATKLVQRLNQLQAGRKDKKEWKVINKEVIELAARELELNPSVLAPVFKGEKKTLLDEMILSMSSKYYKSDRQIRKTITDVIRYYVNQGNVVIVGRAGGVIARNYPAALHVKLQAPVAWRTEVISRKYGISVAEASKYVQETDRDRAKLLADFMGEESDRLLFDMVINCKSFSVDELVEVILKLMEVKKLV